MRTYRFSPPLAAGLLIAGSLGMAGAAIADPSGPRSMAAETSGAPGARNLTLAELKSRLDESDLQAALEALHLALSSLGDGATYVWRKSSRDLAGTIRPTMAFRGADGRVCRHVVYRLSLGRYSKTIEGIACREPDGLWTLSG